MAENSKIEWTTHTFNPWEGCSKISPGCVHCYAEARNHRFGMDNWGKGKPRRRTSESNWKKPLAWNTNEQHAIWDRQQDNQLIQSLTPTRPRVFCASLADWLDDEVPIEWLGDLVKLIYSTPHLDWLLLTKRPENFLPRLRRVVEHFAINGGGDAGRPLFDWIHAEDHPRPDNVWIGVSAENQEYWDERVPKLMKIPAHVRFVSAEPLLGPITKPINKYLDWVIWGGESSQPNQPARPCDVEWIESGVMQCREAGVSCFVKQLGSHPLDSTRGTVNLRDKKGGDMNEWPESIRVREFPV